MLITKRVVLGAGRRISEVRKSRGRLVSAFKNVYSLIGETAQHIIIQESKSRMNDSRESISIPYKVKERQPQGFKLEHWCYIDAIYNLD